LPHFLDILYIIYYFIC